VAVRPASPPKPQKLGGLRERDHTNRVSGMGYKIRYLERERETSHELVADLESAKAIVENYVASGLERSAEVIDSTGHMVFRRPRSLRPS